MPTEAASDFNLDEFPNGESLLSRVASLEGGQAPRITISATVDSWDKIRALMPALRSANIFPVLCLKKSKTTLEREELEAAFHFLRLWDQFTIHNFLELCGDYLPPGAVPVLRTEAKMELKWFREWSTALSDPRIHKYPGLPWRRFIRKINSENETFAVRFLELIAAPQDEAAVSELKALFKGFLDEKKKVVNIFPKRFKPGAAS